MIGYEYTDWEHDCVTVIRKNRDGGRLAVRELNHTIAEIMRSGPDDEVHESVILDHQSEVEGLIDALEEFVEEDDA